MSKRKDSFIEEAGSPGRRWTHAPKNKFLTADEEHRLLMGNFRGALVEGGGYMQKQHSQLWQSS